MHPTDVTKPDGARATAPPSPRNWWTPKLERARLQELLRKRDLPGVLFLLAWFSTLAATTSALVSVWGTLWTIPMLVVHGAVLSFAYAISHECAHGTAFRSRWLNEGVFYLTSFVFGEEPMYRRHSHGRHHVATWYPGYDSQMPYRNPMTLRAYLRETLALHATLAGVALMLRHARGRLTAAEKEFVPAARVRQLIWGARSFLAGYLAVFIASALMQSAFVLAAFFGARLAGGWVVQLFVNSQHMCMSEAVPDHRYSTRSLSCSFPVRLFYWNMNFHIEHHLFPGVPFHLLPTVNRLVRSELPQPTRGALRANAEILRVIRRQVHDPGVVARPSFIT